MFRFQECVCVCTLALQYVNQLQVFKVALWSSLITTCQKTISLVVQEVKSGMH